MKISKNLVNNVVRGIYAADPEEEISGKPAPTKVTERYFYFQVKQVDNVDSRIEYHKLKQEMLKGSPEIKEQIARNITTGIVGKADNFAWRYIVVRTNAFEEGKMVVYSCPLQTDGQKMATSDRKLTIADKDERFKTEDAINRFEKEMNVFASVNLVGEVINLDANGNQIFVKGTPQEKDIQQMTKTSIKYPNSFSRQRFNAEYLHDYRIRVLPDAKTLLTPDFRAPTDDFKGTEKEISDLLKIGKINPDTLKYEGDDKNKSLGDKIEEQKQEDEDFKPVSEQEPSSKEKVENRYKDASSAYGEERESKIVEINEEDPDANYYMGDFSIMRDLVKRQKNKMKIRKQAAYSTVPSINKGQTSTTTPSGKKTIPVSNDPEENKENAKKLDNLGKAQEKMNDEIAKMHKQVEQKYGSMAKRVVGKFLE